MSNESAELLLEQLRLIHSEIRDMRKDHKDDIKDIYKELRDSKKDVATLKTRFMVVAITMGLAGGKLGTILPFLK